jgi:FkbM family methyltransferase
MLINFDYLFSKYDIHTKGALHLGANEGQEASAYSRQGINAVIWVEALPEVYAKLCANVDRYKRHVTLLACVSDKDGETVTFHVANNEGQSSSLLELGTHAFEHPSVRYIDHLTVQTTRVDTLLKRHKLETGPGWFLNIDLQGAELKALEGMGERLNGFDHAYIEVNERELYKGCPLVKDIDAYLARYGFVAMETKMMKQGWGDCYYQRRTA